MDYNGCIYMPGRFETVETFICEELSGPVDVVVSYDGNMRNDGTIVKSDIIVNVCCDKCPKNECLAYKEMKKIIKKEWNK